ncbi:bifunctional adenosylcobinamide kinase/adenosylcobinamide-phosphate guanylyltransferase [Sutcliffiella horikoshii]|uniref:bifunctional adenosylcobinamide kinase/adenosylcobinamide-phosphate guanylyltransferase n=1 Tax=Sutcliffiella horikoshii TaxID=79883 RepID=UPI001653472E|nr:bifunctional adenosylcobinamide kinase/adenosylcobinamide-phosphate guanylyltransferase [Sutcliffiella horikoshii]
MIIFISGGARSGKSQFAEKLALSLYKKAPTNHLIYIATSQKSDKEMEWRIAMHKAQRGKEWKVDEEPVEIGKSIKRASDGDVVLLDCLTIWLSNMLFHGIVRKEEEMIAEVDKWLTLAREKGLSLLIVSNDLNEEPPSSYKTVTSYIYMLELLHQHIVKQADVAVQVRVGIPKYWKGRGALV